uniref:Uncharacterized protein n=1 Tax=Heterorhabditis bacteriophora TaxID=37862 RepID=A0A1I7WP81_HETBA
MIVTRSVVKSTRALRRCSCPRCEQLFCALKLLTAAYPVFGRN